MTIYEAAESLGIVPATVTQRLRALVAEGAIPPRAGRDWNVTPEVLEQLRGFLERPHVRAVPKKAQENPIAPPIPVVRGPSSRGYGIGPRRNVDGAEDVPRGDFS